MQRSNVGISGGAKRRPLHAFVRRPHPLSGLAGYYPITLRAYSSTVRSFSGNAFSVAAMSIDATLA